MLTGTLNATRHAQKPLPQPNYNFSSVPKAQPDLAQSEVHKITQREHFQECMGEMLLLCKEAMRRRRQLTHHKHQHHACSKPLSLDYLADRFDIDDPCFGYMIRSTDENSKGMLQGFITVTTFTNWQTSFRWDSLHPAAYECDSDELIESIAERKRDEDGSLAQQLQNTVHAGNIHQEGIVWPRICEISLLGGLGCGKVLIELIIEELEHLKATNRANYDYVVLQATDNSISFYETMGFVRIGAIMLDETAADAENELDAASPASVETNDSNFFVTSPVTTYTVKSGQSLAKIAQRFGVDVYDLLFLNRHLIGDARPCDRPFLGTVLTIPVAKESAKSSDAPPSPSVNPEEIQWHVAKENETPRTIAKMYNVNALDVVNANKGRLPGLMSSSRLKEGTKIKVSHLHIIEKDYKAYAHWSFPDARFEDPEPSYMMVRKLNRRKQNQRNEYPVLNSLKAPILSSYIPPPLLLPPEPSPRTTTTRPLENNQGLSIAPKKSKKQVHPDAPVRPKRPPSPFILFLADQRRQEIPEIAGRNFAESTQILSQIWNALSPHQKAIYEEKSKAAWDQYSKKKLEYETKMKEFRKTHPDMDTDTIATPAPATSTTPFVPLNSNVAESASMPLSVDEIPDIQHNLYNAVVRLKDGAMTEGSNYKYWYVLTFIPDLKWCHLAPMVQCGTFGPDKPRAKGRPRWKLVSETLGMEVDISSSFCIPIKSRSMRKTVDADKEEWDIIDDGTDPSCVPPAIPRILSGGGRTSVFGSVDGRCSTAVKPSAERVRNKQRSSTCSHGDASFSTTKTEPPLLKATIPGRVKPITVRISGNETFNPNEFNFNSIKKRGRPVVSKSDRSPDSTTYTNKNVPSISSVVKFEIPESTVAPSTIRMRKSPRPKAMAQSLRPSPGGILRRKKFLEAMDAEKDSFSPAPRSAKRKAMNISMADDDEEEDSEDTSYCTSDSTATDDSVDSMESDVASSDAVVTRMSPRRPSRGTPMSVAIPEEGATSRSLRTDSTAMDFDENDPLSALNKNDLAYVLDQGFRTAEQFLKATNAEIAENIDQWREKNGMSKLKSGSLAQASRWKYTVRKRAQMLGMHELVDFGPTPCSSSGSDESINLKKQKVKDSETREKKASSSQSTEIQKIRISPRRLTLSASLSGANAFKNIPKYGVEFLMNENIKSASDFLSFPSNELGKKLGKWRLANGLDKCKSCLDLVNKWKSSVRKHAEVLGLSESETACFPSNDEKDQTVSGRMLSHSSSARCENAKSDVDPISVLHTADLKYLASEGIHSAAEFLTTPQALIRANLNNWREKEGLSILKSVSSSVSKWRSMVRKRAQELGMDELLEMEYKGESGISASKSQDLEQSPPRVQIRRRPSIAKKRKF